MIDDAMTGKIDLIITKSISRFARNTVDCLNITRKLKEKNVPVIFEKENVNTMDSSGELLLSIMSSIAQQESDSLSKNVKIGLQYRYQQGKMSLNYNRFLGYTRDENGKLVIVPEESKVVKRIYREYLEGGSTTGIAKGLERDGILNGAKNKKWWGTNIEQILQNEKYIGDAILQKTYTVDFLQKKRVVNDGIVPQYYVQGSHEAIIPDQIFMEVQAEIARRSAMKTSHGGNTVFSSKYALTGVVVCGECGAPYRRLTWKSRNGEKQNVWRCRKRVTEGPKACNARTIQETDLHKAVIETIKKTIVDPTKAYQKITEEIIRDLTGNSAKLEMVEEQLAKLQQQLVRKINSDEDYNNLVTEIGKLREEKQRLTEQQAVDRKNTGQIEELRKELDKGEALIYSDKLVRNFVEKIEVFPNKLRFTMKAGMTTEFKM